MTIPIYKLGADAKGKPFHALKYVGNDAMSRSGVLYASHKLRCSLIPSFAWQSVEMTNYDCECILRKARVLWLNAGAFQHLFSKKAMSALSCWLPLGLACDHFVPFCDLWPEVLYLLMNILQHSPLDFGFLICFYKIMCTLTFCPFGAWWHGPQAQGSCMMGRCELASLCCTSATCGSPRGPVSCTSFQFFFFGIVLRLTEPVVMYGFAHEARNEWRFSQGYWWRPSCVSFSRKTFRRRVLQKIVCVSHTTHIPHISSTSHISHTYPFQTYPPHISHTYPAHRTYPTHIHSKRIPPIRIPPVRIHAMRIHSKGCNTYPTNHHTYPIHIQHIIHIPHISIPNVSLPNVSHQYVSIANVSIQKVCISRNRKRIPPIHIPPIRIFNTYPTSTDPFNAYPFKKFASAGMAMSMMSMSITANHFIPLLLGGNGNEYKNFAFPSILCKIINWI